MLCCQSKLYPIVATELLDIRRLRIVCDEKLPLPTHTICILHFSSLGIKKKTIRDGKSLAAFFREKSLEEFLP